MTCAQSGRINAALGIFRLYDILPPAIKGLMGLGKNAINDKELVDLWGVVKVSENEDPTVLQSMSRLFKFLPGEQRQAFLQEVTQKASLTEFSPTGLVCDLILSRTNDSGSKCYVGMAGDANLAEPWRPWRFIPRNFVATAGVTLKRT